MKFLDDFARGQRVKVLSHIKGVLDDFGTVIGIRDGLVIVQVDGYAGSNSFKPERLEIQEERKT
jgi:hypothetical protein